MTMNLIFKQTNCLSPVELDNYLQGNLDQAALFRVEDHLLDCELCAAAVDGFSSSEDWATELNIAQQLDFEQMQKSETKVVQMPLIRRLIAIAAMVGLPLIAGMLYWNTQQNQRLFSEHYAYYESDVTVTTRGDAAEQIELEEQLKLALEAYENNDFATSQAIFESLMRKNKEDVVATFYAGLSSLEENQLEKAIDYLEIVRFNSTEYYDAATWYLALTHLKLEKEQETKDLLGDLSSTKDPFYAKRARTLLGEL